MTSTPAQPKSKFLSATSSSEVDRRSPHSKLCKCLRGITSGDILLETTDGRTLRLRDLSRPYLRHQFLLDQLRLTLPDRLGCDTEWSGDSAVASPANQGVAEYS